MGESHPFPERGSPNRLSASGQQSYEGWSCRVLIYTHSYIYIYIYTYTYKQKHINIALKKIKPWNFLPDKGWSWSLELAFCILHIQNKITLNLGAKPINNEVH